MITSRVSVGWLVPVIRRCLRLSLVLVVFATSTGESVAQNTDGSLLGEDDLPAAAVMRLTQHSREDEWNGVYMLQFSNDDRHLAARTRDHVVQIYDLSTGKLVRQLDGHNGFVKAMKFTPDRNQLVTAASGNDESVKIWDYKSGKELGQLAGGGQFLQIDRSNNLVVVDELERRTADLESGEIQTVTKLKLSGEEVVGVMGEAEKLAVVRANQRREKLVPIRIVDAKNKEQAQLIGLPGRPKRMTFSSNQMLAAAVYRRDKTAFLWDLNDRSRKFQLSGHKDRVEMVCFSSDSRFVATASWDRTVKVWDVLSGKSFVEFEGHAGDVCSVAFSNDGKWLASGGTANLDCSILVWDLETRIFSGANDVHQQTNGETEALWKLLGNADPLVAFGAVDVLAKQFEQHLPAIAQRIAELLNVVDSPEIQQLIDRLGSDRYAWRLDAFEQLLKIRPLAEHLLRENLSKIKSVEIRFRIARILDTPFSRPKIELDQWRRLQRLVFALERSASDSSRQLLEDIATGHNHIDISRAAREATERLNRRNH